MKSIATNILEKLEEINEKNYGSDIVDTFKKLQTKAKKLGDTDIHDDYDFEKYVETAEKSFEQIRRYYVNFSSNKKDAESQEIFLKNVKDTLSLCELILDADKKKIDLSTNPDIKQKAAKLTRDIKSRIPSIDKRIKVLRDVSWVRLPS